MENLIPAQKNEVFENLIVASFKSIARHNQRASYLIVTSGMLDWVIEEHNEFLDDLIEIIRPSLRFARDVIERHYPEYIHIVDWVIDLCKDSYAEVIIP